MKKKKLLTEKKHSKTSKLKREKNVFRNLTLYFSTVFFYTFGFFFRFIVGNQNHCETKQRVSDERHSGREREREKEHTQKNHGLLFFIYII